MATVEDPDDLAVVWSKLATQETALLDSMTRLGDLVAPALALNERMLGVRQQMEALEVLLREAEVLVATKPLVVERRARARLETHLSEVAALRAQLRALKPRLRKNMDLQAEREREALLRQRDNQPNEKKTLLREAERGTAALKEASQMMRQERERMQAALEVTQDVSQLAQDAIGHHGELATGIQTGRSLVTRLERRDTTDRVLIGFATAVFFLIVAYIWKTRTIG